jgi:hypothetical protein
MFTDNVPQDAQIVAFCERLEIQRNAARAERDDAFSIGEHAMFCVHHTDAQREANTVGGNCPICNKAQIRQLRAERDSKQSQLKEVNSWLDECVKQRDTANALSLSLCADRDGDAKDRDDEIAVLRADVARLREAIVQTIAEGGNELPEWVEAKLEKALATLNK